MGSESKCANLSISIEFEDEEDITDFTGEEGVIDYAEIKVKFADGDEIVGLIDDFMKPLLYQLDTVRNSLKDRETYDRTELDQGSGSLKIRQYKDDLVKIYFGRPLESGRDTWFIIDDLIEEIEKIPEKCLEWAESIEASEDSISEIKHTADLMNDRE